MNQEFAALLAQVVPVLLLALMLELRQILQASEEESIALRAVGVRTREQLLTENVRKRIARAIGATIEDHVDNERSIERQEAKESYYLNGGLSKIDAFGFTALIGLAMLALTRTEMVALVAAMGGNVPYWEGSIALFVILFSLMQLTLLPVGLEVYKLVGPRWPKWAWKLYAIIGNITGLFIIALLFPYFDSMLGHDS